LRGAGCERRGDSGPAGRAHQLGARDGHLFLQFDDLAEGLLVLVLGEEEGCEVGVAGLVGDLGTLELLLLEGQQAVLGVVQGPLSVEVGGAGRADVLDHLKLSLGQFVAGGGALGSHLLAGGLAEVENGQREGEDRPDVPVPVALGVNAEFAA